MGDDNLLLPAVHDHLVLHLPCCGDEPHDSHLEARRADDLLIAVPDDHPLHPPTEPFAVGSPLVIGWPVVPNGWAELPTTFCAESGAGDRVWRVARRGIPTLVQRRDFARVSHMVPMRIRHERRWFDGIMVDLSEGGVSCALATPPMSLQADIPVQVELTVGTDAVVLGGHVVRTETVASGEVVVGVCFEELSPRMSDQIRKDVFSLQIRQRARGAA
jgi:hypothetical protein